MENHIAKLSELMAINALTASMQVQAFGMLAENQVRLDGGLPPVYNEIAFKSIAKSLASIAEDAYKVGQPERARLTKDGGAS